MIYLAGLLLGFATLVWGILVSGGNLIMFFDPVSFIIVFGIVASALTAGGRWGDFIKSFALWLSKKSAHTEVELKLGVSALDLAFRASNGAGAIGLTLGSVLALLSLHDMSKVGPYLAIALISPFYGMVLSFLIFLPMKLSMQKKLKEIGR